MGHLEPVQNYMVKIPDSSEYPHGDAQYVLFSTEDLNSFAGDVAKVADACKDNSYWAEIKSLAESLSSELNDTVALFEEVGRSPDPNSSDISRAKKAYLSALQQWTAILTKSNDVLSQLKSAAE